MYTGSECEGTVQSVAGIANHQCIPIIGFGGDAAKAIMMDCIGKVGHLELTRACTLIFD